MSLEEVAEKCDIPMADGFTDLLHLWHSRKALRSGGKVVVYGAAARNVGCYALAIASEGKKTADVLGITISTDCNKQLARAHIDAAASGCKMGNSSHASWISSPLASSEYRPDARDANLNELTIENIVRVDERYHTSVRKPRTHAYRRIHRSGALWHGSGIVSPAPPSFSPGHVHK